MVAILVVIAVIIILIGGATLWVVRSRVLRALLVLKSSIVSLSDNDLEVENPETNRADETGEMAKSVLVFKDNMIEGKRLTAEQHES
jgi:methyl-accepting chemotaxis protein